MSVKAQGKGLRALADMNVVFGTSSLRNLGTKQIQDNANSIKPFSFFQKLFCRLYILTRSMLGLYPSPHLGTGYAPVPTLRRVCSGYPCPYLGTGNAPVPTLRRGLCWVPLPLPGYWVRLCSHIKEGLCLVPLPYLGTWYTPILH